MCQEAVMAKLQVLIEEFAWRDSENPQKSLCLSLHSRPQGYEGEVLNIL
jgi:hypothetical protein